MSRIAVLGAGAWGTALALSLLRRGSHQVTLWAHRPQAAAELERHRENRAYLPGFPFPPQLSVSGDDAAVAGAEIALCVVPSLGVRAAMRRLRPHLAPAPVLVSATKGIEDGTGLRMSELIASELALPPARLAVLSGPSFAQEVAAGMPTALTVAAPDGGLALRLQREFSGPALRLYTNEDVAGVELGGALKNVLALAVGVTVGLELGHNSVAALITRGIAEITRLAVASGARARTLAGLSGIGDVVLTCTGSLSRNRSVGIELGRGRRLEDILAAMGGRVAEGVATTHAALGLARRAGVELPIAEQIEAILRHGKHPREAMHELMTRPGRDE